MQIPGDLLLTRHFEAAQVYWEDEKREGKREKDDDEEEVNLILIIVPQKQFNFFLT